MNKNDEDEIFKKQLTSGNLLPKSQYLDLDLVKKHLPSFKYLVTEIENLEYYCTDKVFKHVLSKQNLFESKNAKSLCRTGIPPKYIREFLLKLFNIDKVNEDKFKCQYEAVFKNYNPKELEDFVPYFTGYRSLSESLPIHFLNEDGIQALKEILWMLNSVIVTIEHCPLIIKLCSLILMFCNQAETFEIMKHIMEMNYNLKETFKIRWHMRFQYADNEKIITSMCEAIKEISYKSGKESFDHFKLINFPSEKIYEDMCFGFYIDYLNFYGIIRFLPFFLLEGIKSTYRLSYAIIKTLREDIVKVKSPDQVINVLREKSTDIRDINKLFNLSYTFKLTRYNNKYDFQEIPSSDKFIGKRNTYYLPTFSEESATMTKVQIIKLWNTLPFEIKIKDAKKIYSTAKDGYSLITIYGLNEKYSKETLILFLICTEEDEVFGCLISSLINYTNGKFIRPLTSLLIQITPEVKLYEVELDSDQVLFADSQCLMIGNGPKGPAFRIDNDLKGGYSYSGNCFNSPVLVDDKDGKFKIKKAEIFLLE